MIGMVFNLSLFSGIIQNIEPTKICSQYIYYFIFKREKCTRDFIHVFIKH